MKNGLFFIHQMLQTTVPVMIIVSANDKKALIIRNTVVIRTFS